MASEPRERKDFLLRIRVTQEQRREIEAAAKKMKMDLSSWARSHLLLEAERTQENSQSK